MPLELPLPFRRAFRRDALETAERARPQATIEDLTFFRSACAAKVRAGKSAVHRVVVALERNRAFTDVTCSCTAGQKPGNLCFHIALLLSEVADADGLLPGERFEKSPWYAIADSLYRFGDIEAQKDGVGLRISAGGATGRLQIARPAAASSATIQFDQRLRALTATDQERALVERGVLSGKQRFEGSRAYDLGRALFHAIPAELLRVTYDSGFRIVATHGSESVDLPLSNDAVGEILKLDAPLFERSGYRIDPEGAMPTFRVTLNGDGSLLLTPALITKIDGVEVLHNRRELEKMRCGRVFALPHVKTFAGLASRPRMFGNAAAGEQGSLFGGDHSGLAWETEHRISAHEAFAFVSRHREALRSLGTGSVDADILDARPVSLRDAGTFSLDVTGGTIRLGVTCTAGEESLDWTEIARARRAGHAVIRRGSTWVDISGPALSWADDRNESEIESGQMTLTKLEYLRIRSAFGHGVQVSGAAEAQEFFRGFEDLRDGAGTPDPSATGMSLYPYQETGFRWLWFLQQNSLGGLLCDEMGLGKTHQALALIAAVTASDVEARVLVVSPTSVIDHWKEKLQRYAPGVKFSIHHGGNRAFREGVQVYVTSYGTLRNDIAAFAERPFDLVVLDEIQNIKNRATSVHETVSRLRRRVTIGLTGTPVENSLMDLHTLLDSVVPGYIPSPARFDREFRQPVEAGTGGARERLQRLIHPFVLRRTKTQVLTQLPPKFLDVRYCELTEDQKALYQSVLRGKADQLRLQMRKGATVSYLHVFAVLSQLKQICDHPRLVSDDAGTTSGKWNLFTELVEESIASGQKIVVFSQYVKMLALIEEWLDQRGVAWATIKGSTVNRGAEVDRFRRDPACRVFTASLRAGGVGIDLTAASVVIHYDRWWNQAREDQATDRVHRLGQNSGVQVLKLITRGTLEERIDAIIQRKQMMMDGVVRADDPSLVKQFTRDELEELLS